LDMLGSQREGSQMLLDRAGLEGVQPVPCQQHRVQDSQADMNAPPSVTEAPTVGPAAAGQSRADKTAPPKRKTFQSVFDDKPTSPLASFGGSGRPSVGRPSIVSHLFGHGTKDCLTMMSNKNASFAPEPRISIADSAAVPAAVEQRPPEESRSRDSTPPRSNPCTPVRLQVVPPSPVHPSAAGCASSGGRTGMGTPLRRTSTTETPLNQPVPGVATAAVLPAPGQGRQMSRTSTTNLTLGGPNLNLSSHPPPPDPHQISALGFVPVSVAGSPCTPGGAPSLELRPHPHNPSVLLDSYGRPVGILPQQQQQQLAAPPAAAAAQPAALDSPGLSVSEAGGGERSSVRQFFHDVKSHLVPWSKGYQQRRASQMSLTSGRSDVGGS